MNKFISFLFLMIMSLGILCSCSGQQGPVGPQGEQGQPGKDGVDGQDGQDGKDGIDGKSAYEIFKEYYPEYAGTEKDWITDVAMGNTCNLFGHKWDEGIITLEATKVAEGKKTYTCGTCNEHKYEILPKIEVVDAEVYENAETITFDDLYKMLDNDQYSELIEKHGKIYVYIYSADEHVEDETTTTAEKLQSIVVKCVDAYNAVKESDSSVAFYIINTTHEDNEDSSLLSTYSATTLLVFGEEDIKTLTSYTTILGELRAALNELTVE